MYKSLLTNTRTIYVFHTYILAHGRITRDLFMEQLNEGKQLKQSISKRKRLLAILLLGFKVLVRSQTHPPRIPIR